MNLSICTTTLALFAAIATPSIQASAEDSPGRGSVEAGDAFGESITAWLNEHKVPLAGVGIIKNGRVEHAKVYGRDTGADAAPGTLFDIASLTKPLAAVTTLTIIDKTDFSLDEAVSQYFVAPDVKGDPRHKKLTARNILSHQTGFPNWRSMTSSKKLAFHFEPGSRYAYSGEGYLYLQNTLESKFNTRLKDLSQSFLFESLGMKNTRFYWDGSFQASDFAGAYNANGQVIQKGKRKKENAAAGVLTTIDDYAKFVAHVANGAGLSDSLFDEMISPQSRVKEGVDYGLGWKILKEDPAGAPILFHPGGEAGVRTFVLLRLADKSGIVVFTNSDNGRHVIDKVVASCFPQGEQILAKINKTSNFENRYTINRENRSRYTGTYGSREGFVIHVDFAGDHLRFKRPGENAAKMYAQNENDFIVDDELTMTFAGNDSSEGSSMTIYLNGIELFKLPKVR